MRKWYFEFFIGMIIFLVLSGRSINAEYSTVNRIVNGSFESGLDSWKPTSSGVTVSIVNTPVFEASRSARIDHSKSTSFGIEQTIEHIAPSTRYEIQAFMRSGESIPEKAFMRVAWYASLDGSGSQLSTSDSPEITGNDGWERISFFSTSHSQARSAKLRIIVQMGQVFVDDCSWILVAPTTPTPTFVPTPTPIPTMIPSPLGLPTSTPTPPQNQSDSIIIHEVMTHPPKGGFEWIELFNNSPFPAELRNWYIDDISEGGSPPKPISIDIAPYGFSVVELTSAMFNNAGDSVRLLDSEDRERDVFIYSSSRQGFTYGIPPFSTDGFCFQNPTKGNPNDACITHNEEVLSATTISIKPKQVLSSPPQNIEPTRSSLPNKVPRSSTPPNKLTRSYVASPVTEAGISIVPSIIITPINQDSTPSQSILPQPFFHITISYCVLSIGSILAKMVLS